MSRYFVTDPKSDAPESIEFSELVELVKGGSIITVTDSDGFLEFGLTEALKLRFQPRDRLHVTIRSVADSSGLVPIRFQLLTEGEEPSAALIENRLRHLRQTYAINFLVDAGRETDLAARLRESPDADLEELLAPEDRLYVQAATPGSFFVTLMAKTVAAQRAIRNMASLVYSEGRENMLRRVRADTEIKELEVAAKKASVVASYLDLIGRVERIKSPQHRETASKVLNDALGSSTPTLPKLLPPISE